MRSISSGWGGRLRSESERLSDQLPTSRDLQEAVIGLLDDPACPLSGLEYRVKSGEQEFVIGRSGLGLSASRPHFPADPRDTQVQVTYWPAEGAAPTNLGDLEKPLVALLEGYWKPELRTASAGLPDRRSSKDTIDPLAEQTCAYWSRRNRPCALLFCDLDGFKAVNDNLGHKTGDGVINLAGVLIESITRDRAFVMQNGGDEFCVFMPGQGLEDALLAAFFIQNAFASKDFGTNGYPISLSIGATSTESSEVSGFDSLVQTADAAFREAKRIAKGATRVGGFDAVAMPGGHSPEEKVSRGYLLARSAAGDPNPFASLWCNALSRCVCEQIRVTPTDVAAARHTAQAFVEWARLETLPLEDAKSSRSRAELLDAAPQVAAVDLALAATHGLMRGWLDTSDGPATGSRLALSYDSEQACALVLEEPAGTTTTALEVGSTSSEARTFDLGPVWDFGALPTLRPSSTAIAVLVQLGYERPSLPDSAFLETIVVDDRPSRGGGLPDLWEGAIAELITYSRANPNVQVVYVWGDQEACARTVDMLRDVAGWSDKDEFIAYRSGIPLRDVRSASEALKNAVLFPTAETELVNDLMQRLRASSVLLETPEVAPGPTSGRFLVRRMTDEEFALPREAGCEVPTIAEAYPVVLELARRASVEAGMTDQAGRESTELVDFRLHLTNPGIDTVPAFFRDEQGSLEQYFAANFMEAGGLFYDELTAEGQLERVVSHVAKAVASPKPVCTRRGILVVPHRIRSTAEGQPAELAPLGLVSVRIVPRVQKGEVKLHYSYTWRSVEALIGFPYSLYASVRFSGHLTDRIGEITTTLNRTKPIMADVYYIAHSLHLFTNAYAQNIARRIVEDVTQ